MSTKSPLASIAILAAVFAITATFALYSAATPQTDNPLM